MPTDGVCTPGERRQRRPKEDLLRRIVSKTHYQVRDLDVDCDGGCVTVTGSSRTYYVKQLVTQAVLDGDPHIRLENEIRVGAF